MGPIWMWPLPFAPEPAGAGLSFLKIPAFECLSGNETDYKSDDYSSTTQEYLGKAMAKYGGRTFLVTSPEHPEGRRVVIGKAEDEQLIDE